MDPAVPDLVSRDDLAFAMNSRHGRQFSGATAREKPGPPVGERGGQAARARLARHESAKAREGLGDSAVLADDEKRQAEALRPILPFGGNVVVIDRLEQAHIEFAVLVDEGERETEGVGLRR